MAKEPMFSLNAPEVGQINFKDIDQMLDWIAEEREFWSWAKKPLMNEIGVLNNERRDAWLNSLQNAQTEVQKYKANPSDVGALDSGKNLLNRYVSNGLTSRSPRSKLITSLREMEHGDIVAQAALAAYLGEAHQKSDGVIPAQYRYPARRGRSTMLLFDAGVVPKAMQQVSSALREIGEENSRVFSEIKASNQVAMSELQGLIVATRQEHDVASAERAEQIAIEIRQLQTDKEAALKECNEAHAFYMSHMELEAPVEYWRIKGDSHGESAKIWGRVLIGYAIVGTLLLFAVFILAYSYASDLMASPETKPASLLVLISAGVAAGTTILFWIARFITRLYLSERHMTIDAKLRTTMVKTYLALASNNKVDEKDRALVLAPLFRAGTDGIIQEETGIDSVVAMLARTLERPGK